MAKAKGLDWRLYQRLGDLQSKLGASFDEMLTLVKHTLHEQPYSKAEVCNVLHVSPDELDKISLSEKSRTGEVVMIYCQCVFVCLLSLFKNLKQIEFREKILLFDSGDV